MDYQELLRKRDAYQEGKHLIPELTIASYERAFEIEYTRSIRGEGECIIFHKHRASQPYHQHGRARSLG